MTAINAARQLYQAVKKQWSVEGQGSDWEGYTGPRVGLTSVFVEALLRNNRDRAANYVDEARELAERLDEKIRAQRSAVKACLEQVDSTGPEDADVDGWQLVSTESGNGETRKSSKEGSKDLTYSERMWAVKGSVVRYRKKVFGEEWNDCAGSPPCSVLRKIVDFGWRLDPAPPQFLEIGKPFTVGMHGKKKAQIANGRKVDANAATAILESKQLNINEEMRLRKKLVDGKSNSLIDEKSIEVTRTPGADTPDRIVIKFGRPEAYVQYVYERR